MSIIAINREIYKPTIDSNNGIYTDICPYSLHERQRIVYDCRCKAGCSFDSRSKFNQHIKTKTHKEWIKNYDKYYKEVDDAQNTIKELTIKLQISMRKISKLELANSKLELTNDILLDKLKEKKEDRFYECD